MSYNYCGYQTIDIYNSVIKDVINGVKESFIDEDVDLDILEQIEKVWVDKVEATKCIERKPQKPHIIARPVAIPNLSRAVLNQRVQYVRPDGTSIVPVQIVQPPPLLMQNAPMYIADQPQEIVYLQTVQQNITEVADSFLFPRGPMYQIDGSSDRNYEDKHDIRPKGKKRLQKKKILQLDGNGATMSDSSSEDEEFDPLRRIVEKIGNDEDIPEDEDQVAPEEPPLNSDDDENDEDLDRVFDTKNVIICQFEKINRSRSKWKLNLKDGIMKINERDHCFTKAGGEATF